MRANLAASVRQRLRNLARDQGVDYNRLQLLYVQERWLARLAHSSHRDRLILKGGLYLYGSFGLASRPTRDIDFMGRATPAEVDQTVQMAHDIASIDLPDGVHFDPNTIRGEENRAATEYGGVRIDLTAYLGSARERLQIDVGFGDALPTGPTALAYPTLLDTPPPNVLAYSLETVIAEKLQAATVLYEVNSRYKDFYDTHQLAISQAFEAQDLHRAIEATFNRRGRAIPEAHRLFAPAFTDNQDRQVQWSAFLKRIRQTSPDSFTHLMEDINAFIGPILNGAKKGSWNPAEGAWTNAESTWQGQTSAP